MGGDEGMAGEWEAMARGAEDDAARGGVEGTGEGLGRMPGGDGLNNGAHEGEADVGASGGVRLRQVSAGDGFVGGAEEWNRVGEGVGKGWMGQELGKAPTIPVG
jgi:hypothetical protein